jgi:hypothetical protein
MLVKIPIIILLIDINIKSLIIDELRIVVQTLIVVTSHCFVKGYNELSERT